MLGLIRHDGGETIMTATATLTSGFDLQHGVSVL